MIVVDPELKLKKKIAILIYKTRMMIEERFRDTKDAKYGSGFLVSRSKDAIELEGLLLLDAITKFIFWLVGAYAEAKGFARFFQANTIRNRRVLSVVRLGSEVINKRDRETVRIDSSNYKEALSIWRGLMVTLEQLCTAAGQKM